MKRTTHGDDEACIREPAAAERRGGIFPLWFRRLIQAAFAIGARLIVLPFLILWLWPNVEPGHVFWGMGGMLALLMWLGVSR